MPTKRSRMIRHRHEYPLAIQALLADEEPEETEESREALIRAYYFNHFLELGPEIERKAGAVLDRWRAKRSL